MSSPTVVAVAKPRRRACGCAAARAERAAHFAVRRAVFVDEQEHVRRRRPRRARRQDHDAARDRHRGRSRRRARCGCTRCGDGAWKGDRLAVLPEARARRARRAARALRRARPRARAAATRMVAHDPARPTWRFFELARLAARRRRRSPSTGARTSRWRSRSTADRVSGSAARSHTSADSPPPARRSTRESSKVPHGAQARPRRAKAAHAASTCSGAAARTKPKLGKVSSQRSSGDAVGARQALDVERRAAAGELEQLQQRAGDAGHRDVARGVAEPALGDLDERLAVLAQLRRVAVAQRA